MAVTITTEPKPILTLDLTPEEASRIQEAQRQGVDLDEMLKGMITRLTHSARMIHGNASHTPPTLTLEEMEAQVQQDFEKSGMSEEELSTFVNDLVHRVRADMDPENQ